MKITLKECLKRIEAAAIQAEADEEAWQAKLAKVRGSCEEDLVNDMINHFRSQREAFWDAYSCVSMVEGAEDE